MRSRRLVLALMAVALTVGCQYLSDPMGDEPLPAGAAPIDTLPPVFTRYWHEIDSCSQITRPMSAIRFYIVPEQLIHFGDTVTIGLYQQRADRIVYSSVGLADSFIVRHEMLHAHLRGIYFTNNEGHPSQFFRQLCGAAVNYYPPDHPGD